MSSFLHLAMLWKLSHRPAPRKGNDFPCASAALLVGTTSGYASSINPV